MTMFISAQDVEWQDHPVEAGVKTKPLAQLPEQKLRFRLNRVGKEGLTEHSHPNGHIFFIWKGRGKMWIEDEGSLTLAPGAFIVVPPDLKHRVFDVLEPIELLSIAPLG